MTLGSVPVSENDIVHGKAECAFPLRFLRFGYLDTEERVLYPRTAEGRGIDSGDVVSTPRPGKDLRVQLASGIEVGVSLVDPSEYETRNRSRPPRNVRPFAALL